MRRLWIGIVLVGACVRTESVNCELGGESWTCPADALCDPARVGCITENQLTSCNAMEDGTPCTIGESTIGVCRTQVCEVSVCGDGLVVAPEQCDDTNLGAEPSCKADGFYDDKMKGCKADCTYETEIACTGKCGDGVVNGPELCDGGPPSLACTDLGYNAGFLDCSQCGPGLDDCKLLQWASHVGVAQLTSVHGHEDPMNGLEVNAVGYGPVVSHFDGSTWSEIDASSCAPAGKRFTFGGVFTLGNGKMLLAGGEGLDGGDPLYPDSVIVSIDGTVCTRTLVAVGGQALDDVLQFSPTNIWAVGNGMFHFDGTTWSRSNPTISLSKLWASGPNDIYAAGAYGVWHWNGTTWTEQTTASTYVFGVVGFSANDVYIGGDSGIEHWNGTTWSAPEPSPGTGVLSLGSDGTHLVVGTYKGLFVRDGASWSSLAMPLAYYQPVEGLWGASTGTVFAATENRIARYPGGAISTTTIGNQETALAVVDADTAYALTANGLYVYDGATWTEDPATPVRDLGSFTDMWRAPNGVLFFSRYSGAGNTLVSWAPNGTWSELTNTNDAFDLWGSSATDIWVMSAGFGTVFQHYNGTDIDAACSTCSPGGQYQQMWGAASDDIFAVGLAGAIVHWDGSAWTAMTSGTTADLIAVWGSASDDVYAIGAGTFLHYNGTAWSALPALAGAAYGRSLWGTGSRDIFASTPQGLYHYDGVRWSPVRTGLDSNIKVIDGTGDQTFMLDDNAAVVRLVRTVDWSN